jgi:quinoprotein glucose dehydrogenase
VVTGELEWIFHTIPHPGEYGYETWPRDAYMYAGGANTWGEITVDAERGIAYFPTGSPTYDYYGADRIGENLFGTSIVALDARTGERIWHFQVVHHDLFDYDITAAPQLVTLRRDEREIDAVAVATKQGFLFVFDRVTGEPVWPIEERPVPPSDVPGEEAWPTQPFPTVIPPFARQSLTAEDAKSPLLTPEEQVEWSERIGELVRTGRSGLFTPPSHLAPLLAIPGAVGGANWGGTAANPEEGMVYIYTIDTPSFYENLELREAEPEAPPLQIAARERGRALYEQNCQGCHAESGAGFGSAPPVLGLNYRMEVEEVRALLSSGMGEMPAFTYLDSAQVSDLYTYMGSLGGGGRGGFGGGQPAEPPTGPVVASGGAPGGLEPRNSGGRGGGRLGPPYPEGAEAPAVRYYSQGYGLGEAWAISPPWSSLVAYDLNEGTIAWQRPLGTDLRLAEDGWTETGLPQAQRHGMVVTSTGVVFATAGDGRIYALDGDTGDELWRGDLPMGTEGIPAMYEFDGKQHLVVTATTTLRWGRGDDEEDGGIEVQEGDPPQRGYVVYALPEDAR